MDTGRPQALSRPQAPCSPLRSTHAVLVALAVTLGLGLAAPAHAGFKPAAKASAPMASPPQPVKAAVRSKIMPPPKPREPDLTAPRSSAQCADLTTQLSLGVEPLTEVEMRYFRERCSLPARSR